MSQIELDRAISCQSYKLLNKALVKGAVINNRWSKKNTLNRAIRSTLNNNLNGFSLKIINRLIDHGAVMHNNGSEHDTLAVALNCANAYISSFPSGDKRVLAEDNVMELLNLLIQRGVDKIDLQSRCHIVSSAIKTGRLNIVNLFTQIDPSIKHSYPYGLAPLELDPCNIRTDAKIIDQATKNNFFPDNFFQDGLDNGTLDCAVSTKNIDIINIALKYGAKPSQNTLTNAIQTNDPKIIQDIVILGGKPCNASTQWDHWSTFYNLYSHYGRMKTKFIDFQKVDQIIELLMCSGATVSRGTYRHLINDSSALGAKILDCYYLFNEFLCPPDRVGNVIELKHRLQSRMKQLVKFITDVNKNRSDEIENTIMCMPVCCASMINEYLMVESKFEVIDWSNINRIY